MISDFKAKLKEAAISVIPIMAIVVLLHFTIAPLQNGQIIHFITGGILLILGLAIFLVGADLAMVPFGQMVGSALTHKRNLLLLTVSSFAIGFAITIAEPDVQVLATQVNRIAPGVNRMSLLGMIALGVAFFLVIGAIRTVFKIPLRWLLILFYILVFIACSQVEPAFIGVAFDAGGATTGPITVPFIMALGIGVAAATKKSENDDSSFGLVGLASIGPIAAVAFMGMASSVSLSGSAGEASGSPAIPSLASAFLDIVPHIAEEILMALLPIILIFLVFNFTMLKLPRQQVRRMISGMVYTFIGLVIFMVGVNGGFTPAGQVLGEVLGSIGSGGVLIPIGLLIGAVVVCAEPAVWVLTEQVEEVSGGYIRRPILLGALSISIALAVVLGMTRVLTHMSIWYVLLPGYGLALLLTFFCPKLFTAIAFDSGGVASGPMSTTFVLSLTLGASYAVGGNPATDAFGMIAMIAMGPLITIQMLGIAVAYLEKKQKNKANKGGGK